MANQDLTVITETTSPASTDIAYTVTDPAGAKNPRRSTWANILKIYDEITATLTNKTQSVDLNSIIQDTPAAGNYLRDNGTKFVGSGLLIADLDVDPRARSTHTGTQTLSTISDVSITATNLNILDDAVSTALHFHDADRARANHTGTQAHTTISDFDVGVQTNRLDQMAIPTATVNLNGQNADNIQNLIHDQSVSGTDIDFLEDEVQTISIAVNTTFTTVNRVLGKSKTLKIVTDATLRTLTFPAWKFIGTKPADQAASKTGVLTVTCFGTADTDIVAAYAVEA